MLLNLLKNAIIHGRDESHDLVVEVGSEVREDEGTVIYVRDYGRGILEADREHIFDYFYRGQDAGSGIGIGLAFCRRILESQGNRLWIEPTPGGGATFLFTVTEADGLLAG